MTTETMQAINALKDPVVINREFLCEFFETFPAGFLTIPCFFCFCIVFLYWLLWGKPKWDSVITVLYELAAVMTVYFILFYRGRYLRNRVDVGLWLAVCLVILWVYQEGKSYFSNRVGLALLLTVFCSVQPAWKKNWRMNAQDDIKTQRKIQKQLDIVAADKDHLYVTKIGALALTEAYGVFDCIPFGIAENVFPLGGWPGSTELFKNLAAEYDVENPFRDLINNEKAYLVDNDIESTLQYLQTYYDKNAYYVEIGQLGSNTIYQIVSD